MRSRSLLGGALIVLVTASCNAILGLDPVMKRSGAGGVAGGGVAGGGGPGGVAGTGGVGGVRGGSGGGSGGVAGLAGGSGGRPGTGGTVAGSGGVAGIAGASGPGGSPSGSGGRGAAGGGGGTGAAGAPGGASGGAGGTKGAGGAKGAGGTKGSGGAGGAGCGGELLRNGDFEFGEVAWNSVSEGEVLIVEQNSPTLGAAGPVVAPSGTWLVHLGGAKPSQHNWINQVFTIPANAIEVTATGYVRIRTEEPPVEAFDLVTVTLGGDGGYPLLDLGSFSNLDSTATWTAFEFSTSVGAMAGTMNIFMLKAKNSEGDATDFLFDNVSLRVTRCR